MMAEIINLAEWKKARHQRFDAFALPILMVMSWLFIGIIVCDAVRQLHQHAAEYPRK